MRAPLFLHIFLTPIENESRLLREVDSTLTAFTDADVRVLGIWNPGLKEVEQRSERVSIVRIRLRSRGLMARLPTQIVKYAEWVVRVVADVRKHRPTIIHCHGVSSLPVGALCKLFTGAALLYDAHELESERQGVRGLRKRLARIVERSLVRVVDSMVVVGDSIADWYCDAYDISRPTVLPNVPRRQTVVAQDLFRGKFNIPADWSIFLYQGVLSEGRAIDKLCAAFRAIGGPRALVLMGYGSLEQMVMHEAATSPHIFFHPAVPPERLLPYTASGDYGVALIEDSCLSYRHCMPNKIFEYLMAGLPIVVSNLPDIARLVRSENVGVVASDWTPDGIRSAAEELERTDGVELRKQVADTALRYCWEEYEARLLDEYRRMLRGSRALK